MPLHARTSRLAVGMFVAILAAATRASADPAEGDAARAEALFQKGRALLDAGRFEEACPLLAESQRLDPGAGTLLNLARCHDKTGKLVAAYKEYSEGLSLSIQGGRHDRELFARERLAALEARLPHLRVNVDRSLRGVKLGIDGVAATPGEERPVDPGEHVIAVRAGDREWSAREVVREGESRVVEVPLHDAQSPAAPAPSGAPAPPEDDAPGPAPAGPRSSVFYVLLAVSGVSAVASATLGVLTLGARADVDADCNLARRMCGAAGLDAADRARTWGYLAVGTGIVSALTLGAALSWPREARRGPTATVAPSAGGLVIGVRAGF